MQTSTTHPLVRPARYAALGIVALALVLRVRGLGEYWLNADEGIYYSTLTHRSFEAFWTEVVANAHPPAFYLLLRGMGYVTWDFVVLRAAPLLFGVAAVWVFWLVGRALGGPGPRGLVAGLIAAAWLALSPEAIVLSQVLRPYTLVILLLASALASLLYWRGALDGSPPGGRDGLAPRTLLALYAGSLTLAVLTHYSAALGIGALSVLVAWDLLRGVIPGPARRDLLLAHAVPTMVFAVLYLVHVSSALGSDLMGEALGPGGWLSDWLVDSPEAAWRGFVAFQNYHVPPELRVRTAMTLLAAIGVSAVGRDRAVAFATGGALVVAVSASALGLYPFGPSRHDAWLVVFTIPALAWLVATILTAPRFRALAGVGAIAVLWLVSTPLERMLGGPEALAPAVRTNATEERVIRRVDLAPLVVERLDPGDEPTVILLTEQSYNMLMPIWAADRNPTWAADSTAFHLPYGRRRIVVASTWDWRDSGEVARYVAALPSMLPELDGLPDRVLVVAGGWGSSLIPEIPGLGEQGVALEQTWAPGQDALGRLIPRMTAVVFDSEALIARDPGA